MTSNTLERIYRDSRIPDLEIRNNGFAIFNVWVRGLVPNHQQEDGWSNTDCFTRYPAGSGADYHSAESAEQAAIEWFDDYVGIANAGYDE
jgi:hypothetical protein